MDFFGTILIVLSFWFLHKVSLRLSEGISEYLLWFFLGIVANAIPVGYFLSAVNQINKPFLWGLFIFLLGLVAYLLTRKRQFSRQPIEQLSKRLGLFWLGLATIEKAIFGLLFFAFLLCSIINLLVLLNAYPNEWDSMTGHLVKCAYYLQNGNMGRVNATTWSVDYYPNSLPTLQILGYHLFGEKGFVFIHFLSYWCFVVAVYAIARELFENQKGAIFAALMAALLPSALIQAATTETDIIQTAYLVLVVYFVIKTYKNNSWKYLAALIIITSVWISHKVTFLLIAPAVSIIFIYLLVNQPEFRKKIVPAIALFGVCFCVYVLPNGYWANLKATKHFSLGALSAPAQVMAWHGIEHYSWQEKINNFELNTLRYTSDFLHLDGLRNTAVGAEINRAFRWLPNKFFAHFNVEQMKFWAVNPFRLMGHPEFRFYQERPFWGIISFLLVLPVVLTIILNFLIKKENRKALMWPVLLAMCSIVHFLSLCFSAPYDPIKGRYFMNMAIWCLPLVAYFFVRKSPKPFLLVCSVIVAISAVFTLSHRRLYPLFGPESVFKLDRISQLNISRPENTAAYRKFDSLVPEDAIVALGTQQEHEDFEYPLWGKAFKRKMIPIHPFRSAVKPIPEEAQYLLYSEGVIPHESGDVFLGGGDVQADTPVPESKFYLRSLKE